MEMEIIIMESVLRIMKENRINPDGVASIGYEDHDFYIALTNGESFSFNPYTERER